MIVRPCDGNETAEAWQLAISRKKGPVGLVLSRQCLPVLDRPNDKENRVALGAYIISEAKDNAPEAIIIGTGSEVHIALEAQQALLKEGINIRVVSMPCWEAFQEQSDEYKELILPKSIKARISIEAGITFGWSRWIGDNGVAIGIDTFGASAPGADLAEEFGFTAPKVEAKIREHLGSLL